MYSHTQGLTNDKRGKLEKEKQVDDATYINLVDARELFEHVQLLNKKIADQEKVFERRIQEVRENYRRQLEQHKRAMEVKLMHHHERTRHDFRQYQQFQDGWLDQYTEEQNHLWDMTRAQNEGLQKMAGHGSIHGADGYQPRPFSQGAANARVYISEFEFYVYMHPHLPRAPEVLIQRFAMGLRGRAYEWVYPILQDKHRFRSYYRDFNAFLDAFAREFAHGKRYSLM